jgi:hypothetical protein
MNEKAAELRVIGTKDDCVTSGLLLRSGRKDWLRRRTSSLFDIKATSSGRDSPICSQRVCSSVAPTYIYPVARPPKWSRHLHPMENTISSQVYKI